MIAFLRRRYRLAVNLSRYCPEKSGRRCLWCGGPLCTDPAELTPPERPDPEGRYCSIGPTRGQHTCQEQHANQQCRHRHATAADATACYHAWMMGKSTPERMKRPGAHRDNRFPGVIRYVATNRRATSKMPTE